MEFYGTADDESRALRRAAHRACCHVERLTIRRGAPRGVPRLDAVLACPDGWAAARLLLALAIEDAKTPGAAALARTLRARARDDESFARELVSFVRSRVRFEREEGERFASGAFTLSVGFGDCDDHFRLLYALATAGGLPAALAALHPGSGGPSHVAALLWLNGAWRWAETTIAAELGENPNDAAARLGLTRARTDIAREIEIMTDDALQDVPAGFRARNPSAQVLRDAASLKRLGFLAEDAQGDFCDAADPVLRAAVLAFQVATGLVPDGLLGPTTRAQLATELRARFSPAEPQDIGAIAPRYSPQLEDDFFPDVAAMAARMRARGAKILGSDLLAVLFAESGIQSIQNGAGAPAYGINQLLAPAKKDANGVVIEPRTYPGLLAVGFDGTPADYLALSPREQLPFVERYFENATRGRLALLADMASLYFVNFTPAWVEHAADPAWVIAREGDADRQKAGIYRDNRAIDWNGKGWIEVRDLGAFVRRQQAQSPERWKEISARYRDLVPYEGAAGGVAGVVGVGVVLAAMAGATWWIAERYAS